jgi:aryl-alcohol dehydrogenase-like predicted oxidoreductase
MVTREQEGRRSVERVQTGVRIERRILLVLKALAASHGMTLGDLVEGIVLHAFEGAAPFGPESMAKIRSLSEVYGLDLDASDSHLLVERKARGKARK